MKKTLLFIVFLTLILRGVTIAQNPYQSLGKEMPKGKMLTLSNGKFQEFFPNDTLVPIGSVMYNTITGDVVAFLTRDTMYAEYNLEPELVSRWLSPDPLGAKFTQWSPYHYAYNNPLRFIDPDGRSGEPIFDEKKKTVTINSTFIAYGGEAKNYAAKFASNVAKKWNAAGGTVKVDGKEYKANFKVSVLIVSEAAAKELASTNKDPKINFVRIEASDQSSNVGKKDTDGGSNSFYINTKQLDETNSTTAAHEYGHSLGLNGHTSEGNFLEGQPDIMSTKNTLVEEIYSTNPPIPASNGKEGYRLDTQYRNVLQSNLDGININRTSVGKVDNIIYDSNGSVIQSKRQ